VLICKETKQYEKLVKYIEKVLEYKVGCPNAYTASSLQDGIAGYLYCLLTIFKSVDVNEDVEVMYCGYDRSELEDVIIGYVN